MTSKEVQMMLYPQTGIKYKVYLIQIEKIDCHQKLNMKNMIPILKYNQWD
jgi:hypothetical protein